MTGKDTHIFGKKYTELLTYLCITTVYIIQLTTVTICNELF